MHGWLHSEPRTPPTAQRRAVAAAWLQDEIALSAALAERARLSPAQSLAVQTQAADWIRGVREQDRHASGLDAFMREYDLSSAEGVLLMCLAEALLRIPDHATAEKLIADKLGGAAWKQHLGHSDSLFVNASTWGLMLTGRLVQIDAGTRADLGDALRRLAGKLGEPAIRLSLRHAMRLMAEQFVMGRSIDEALDRASRHSQPLCSFDMLGEAAVTAAQADRYRLAYLHAIAAVGASGDAGAPVRARPGISIKLSALHPRYEPAQAARLRQELLPRLLELARAARQAAVCLTVDAEEADRLELSLDLFEPLFLHSDLAGWEGLGLAVQAFSRRAPVVIDWLQALAVRGGRRLQVRLVKGAYWDTEIKRAQELGLDGYPVFTRKARTDLCYLACARQLLAARAQFYPMFATHNAHTVAAVRAYADDEQGYEFQRLHGMGESLYRVVGASMDLPCRVYAPVGRHEDLLPYLVRRLLENGANTSFVNRIHDAQLAPERLAADPAEAALAPVAELAPPAALFGVEHRNPRGLNLADDRQMRALAQRLAACERAGPLTVGSCSPVSRPSAGAGRRLCAPADRRLRLGDWHAFDLVALPAAVQIAQDAQAAWDARPVQQRVQPLRMAAERLEAEREDFLYLLIREAGKTLADADAEVREAIDFLRYYAAQAQRLQQQPIALPGPTGEDNQLRLHGRGVFACVSPWNFPLAIFTGQIAAALASGNTVVAKPAEQTPLIARRMTRLLHQCGVPAEVLQLLLGDGELGAALVSRPGIAGVAFTGSFEVAQRIQRGLAAREGPLAALIAETGGQNALIADSSALPEQLVRDVLRSAFGSAGQRCSALRVLYLQQEIAASTIELLRGAMRELSIGDPALLSTDIGPVIDADACERLQAHAESLRRENRLIEQLNLPSACAHGTFFAPCLAQVEGIQALSREHFGPILHVARYRAQDLDAVVDAINTAGYGLTLGVHTRIERTWQQVRARARVGNLYVNRVITGAVVGSQPFGGEGLSGTGPKAGGPHYLLRFVTERSLSVNTAAVGGNAQLLRGDR